MEETFVKHISNKGLVSILYKELLKPSNKKINNPVEKWTKEPNIRYLTKAAMLMSNKEMKRCYTSYVMKEWQIKTRCHYSPLRMVKIQKH